MTYSDDGTTAPLLTPTEGDALLVIDVQIDFLPGGALAVAHGDEVVPILNRYLKLFAACGRPVVLSRDAHPPNHCSFRAQGGPWPVHCVLETNGGEFAPELQVPLQYILVSKATTPEREAYSDFTDTNLADRLRDLGVRRLWVGGLATDYCVRETVLDARAEGFEVLLLIDAVRAVEVQPGDGARALEEMVRAGAVCVRWLDCEVSCIPARQ